MSLAATYMYSIYSCKQLELR